jgi:16S rRNA (uracil1498-N3)-methyltransferase
MDLPASAARHVQVLRLQPGDAITLFEGQADAVGGFGEYAATVTQMGRSHVQVQVGAFTSTLREPARRIHLAVGMPANERMDWLVEKAAELGVCSIQPLMTERSVLKLTGERADKKQAHWQSVAIAACEQCGGNRVPLVHPVLALSQWLKMAQTTSNTPHQRLLLSLQADSLGVQEAVARCTELGSHPDISFLSGPEGGLSPAEEASALSGGFQPVTLGPRVLRAETAALVALATLLV